MTEKVVQQHNCYRYGFLLALQSYPFGEEQAQRQHATGETGRAKGKVNLLCLQNTFYPLLCESNIALVIARRKAVAD